ncbi:MAG TPA: NAD(P)H-dependent oxidoreductase [Cellvibrio sp.]|nr:NAD(P)H-dependent oxidoreductase [Cellvibrio sp.]
MNKILRIDASPRGERSHSRRLTEQFVKLWSVKNPGTEVIHRDLKINPPTPVSEAWIAAAFKPAAEQTAPMKIQLKESDLLLRELINADLLVIGLPLYNFSVPATFKAWIDQIVRINHSFLFEPDDEEKPYKPLLANKPVFIIITSGDSGYEPGGSYYSLNHTEPYLRTVFPFIGINTLHFIYMGNDEFGGARLEHSITAAEESIRQLIVSNT